MDSTHPFRTYTEEEKKGLAVHVDHLCRGYGKSAVLDNLDMNVRKGSIYGLLGPSGCGKTTLLKIILGRLVPDAGAVSVLGEEPGCRHWRYTLRNVGYAPQELALFTDLSIGENLRFHARLHQMQKEDYHKRKAHLLELLDLPSEKRIVKSLSGGQKRRVSLAIALLHQPALLVLDEPTVGVDPVLRATIWDYLRRLADEDGVTIIITTHYIEECRQADTVGMLRNGRLLAEDDPSLLLKDFEKDTLEDVFLHLCKRHAITVKVEGGQAINADSSEQVAIMKEDEEEEKYNHLARKPHRRCCVGFGSKLRCPRFRIVAAIIVRKWANLVKDKSLLLYVCIMPALVITLFCAVLGNDPKNLKMIYVNDDVGWNLTSTLPTLPYINCGELYFDCINTNLSEYITLKKMDNLTEAQWEVEHGNAWGVIHAPTYFSQFLPIKYEQDNFDNDTIQNGGDIHLYMDNSNQQIAVLVETKLGDAFPQLFNLTLALIPEPFRKLVPTPPSLSPLYIEKPLVGSSTESFETFIAPGIITIVSYAFAIFLTAVSFVHEKNDGNLDRAYAAGVNPTEIILGHYISYIFIVIFQIGSVMLIAFVVFETPMVGSFGIVALQALLLAFTGMSLGLLISSLVHREFDAQQLSFGTFFPMFLLSGIIWPLEANPPVLYYPALAFPTTWGAETLRSTMIRGWPIWYPEVYTGLAVTFGWFIFLLLLATISLRDRQ